MDRAIILNPNKESSWVWFDMLRFVRFNRFINSLIPVIVPNMNIKKHPRLFISRSRRLFIYQILYYLQRE